MDGIRSGVFEYLEHANDLIVPGLGPFLGAKTLVRVRRGPTATTSLSTFRQSVREVGLLATG